MKAVDQKTKVFQTVLYTYEDLEKYTVLNSQAHYDNDKILPGTSEHEYS